MKKVIAMMLTLAMLTCAMPALGVTANEAPAGSPIGSVEDFINMEPNGVYYLSGDIDFSSRSYDKHIYQKEFKGVLDGNGFALLGITINCPSGDTGIFANWFSGTLKNLTIGSKAEPITVSSTGAGYSVAAIAGTMRDGAAFDRVTVYGNIKGDGKTSGFTSYIASGKITVTDCAMHGSVTGDPAAGFFALSNGDSSEIVIRNSYNYATVTARGSSAGGFYTVAANVNGTRGGSLTVTGCVNFGTVTATDWRCGGIVGEFHENKSSTLTVDYCYNMGTITMKGGGGFACGIVGGASFDAPNGKRTISNVYNAGEVKNTENASHAYAIAYANSNTQNATVTNAAYLDGTASVNIKENQVTKASNVAALLETVTAYPVSSENNRYVADTAEQNSGYPILSREVVSHTNVKTYACGRKVCLDCGAIVTKANEENHTMKEVETQPNGYVNGYVTATCTACGAVEIRDGKPSAHAAKEKNGVYEIATSDALIWYAANVEAGLLTGYETLVLTADLDMKGKATFAVGSKAHPFGGKLDGQGHTVKNFTYQSNGDDGAGLFPYLTMGASITHLALDTVTVTGSGPVGALVGTVTPGAVVSIRNVAVNGATLTSTDSSAGGLIGSTDLASDVTLKNASVDAVTVKGRYAGGFAGNGNALEMENCFVNAKLEASAFTGSLAYHTGRFTQKNCFFVRNAPTNKADGRQIKADAFASGEVAYRINQLSASYVFGCLNGKTAFGEPTHRVLCGETPIYTSDLLSTKGFVYTDTKTVVFAVDRDEGVRLMDETITLTANGQTKEIAYRDLTLTRRVTLGGKAMTADADTALYTLSLSGVTAYKVGTRSGDAIIVSTK